MTDEERFEILARAKNFYRENVTKGHIKNTLKCAKLSTFDVHPFLALYLANFLSGNSDARSIAQALVYPRVLGTSITTSFGTQFQKFCIEVLSGFASVVPGLDIEFIDHVDGRRKYCQIKTGTNTINKDDVATIESHFTSIKNLARTNHLDVRLNDLVVGVLRGTKEELSGHYKRVNETYPVYVGEEFWYRLTGSENFYYDLIEAVSEIALEVDGSELLNDVIDKLAADIEKHGLIKSRK